jgi:hypothetical protein
MYLSWTRTRARVRPAASISSASRFGRTDCEGLGERRRREAHPWQSGRHGHRHGEDRPGPGLRRRHRRRARRPRLPAPGHAWHRVPWRGIRRTRQPRHRMDLGTRPDRRNLELRQRHPALGDLVDRASPEAEHRYGSPIPSHAMPYRKNGYAAHIGQRSGGAVSSLLDEPKAERPQW